MTAVLYSALEYILHAGCLATLWDCVANMKIVPQIICIGYAYVYLSFIVLNAMMAFQVHGGFVHSIHQTP